MRARLFEDIDYLLEFNDLLFLALWWVRHLFLTYFRFCSIVS